MEAGVLVLKTNGSLGNSSEGTSLYWHLPQGRTAGSLPDSRDLWDLFWENRAAIRGFAHSHPGGGVPGPSYTDVTTFAAIESALGLRIDWWITSDDHVVVCQWVGPDKLTYGVTKLDVEPHWADALRKLSVSPSINARP